MDRAGAPSNANKILQCASKLANQFSIAGVLGVNEETHPVLAASGLHLGAVPPQRKSTLLRGGLGVTHHPRMGAAVSIESR
jgi:hypothetical protein